jgi:GH24 family phage-related lysozyme (muramidase)
MRTSVVAKWREFNTPIEGLVRFMYQDIKGLITIGMGNLIDPVGLALSLPFRKRGGGPFVGQAEIRAEWDLIKSKPELAQKGYTACDPLCTLELDNDAIDQLIARRLWQNVAFLKHHKAFATFDDWPADAQMGLLSMAWAMGPGFGPHWPKFSGACEKLDFAAAADNCRVSEVGNPGVVKRNDADERLFRNADAVLAGEAGGFYSRDTLYYPAINLRPDAG